MESLSFRLESSFDPIQTHSFPADEAALVLTFGLREHLDDPMLLENLQSTFPQAKIVGCSTAGEIYQQQFKSESVVGLALQLEKSRCEVVVKPSSPDDDFFALGREISINLDEADLKMVLLLPEGINVDCDDLLAGIQEGFAKSAPLIFGGLAGDSLDFEETLLLTNDGPKNSGVVAVGFYGDSLQVKSAVSSQYSKMGPVHHVTRADGNKLLEVDGLPALDVFLDEIGAEFDSENPALTTLVDFPLLYEDEDGVALYARTPMYIDESEKSMLYAGSLRNGRFRFSDLRINHDLLEGARIAAENASMNSEEECALVVSCAARRVALGVAVDQELNQVGPGLNPGIPLVGFYAYGEIGFCKGTGKSEVLNHSLSVVTFREI